MSKIEKELVEATELPTKRGEDRQDFLARLVKAVPELSDDEWEKLSKKAQDWFNDAADAKNAKAKTLPDFPDVEADAEPEAKTSRRGAAKEEKREPQVGDVAKITTKRGKVETGTIVEIDDKIVAIKMGNGEEMEFNQDRVESIEIAGGAAKASKDEPDAGPAEPKVGAVVKLVTKRGKEVTGKIVEIDADVIVLDVDGKEEEFDQERVASVTVQVEKAAGRRGAAKADKEEEKADGDKKRASNGGVSVGERIKEIIADDLEATIEDISKTLTKEGLEFRDNTLKLNYTDCHKFIAILKAKKMLKA